MSFSLFNEFRYIGDVGTNTGMLQLSDFIEGIPELKELALTGEIEVTPSLDLESLRTHADDINDTDLKKQLLESS